MRMFTRKNSECEGLDQRFSLAAGATAPELVLEFIEADQLLVYEGTLKKLMNNVYY